MIEYRGKEFTGYNKPMQASKWSKHKYTVLAKEWNKIKIIHFGHRDYKHNYSLEAKKSFRARHKCDIVEKWSKLTAAYRSCWFLWPKWKEPNGKARV